MLKDASFTEKNYRGLVT